MKIKTNRKTSYWCNECHCKVKTTENKCPKCNSQDLDGIKKKPEIKFYFHIMEGWYLLPTIVVGQYRFPEDVGANTFEMGFAFLCFNLQIEFWWNISDVKRIESADDILELALKLDSQETNQ